MERRRIFSREFKIEAVRLVTERGVAVAQAAKDLEVHENVLRKWVRELRDEPQGAFPGNASICFMALILYRVMRQRLKCAGSDLSPEAALADLRRIQRHSVSIDHGAPIQGVSNIHQRQTDILAALSIKKPAHDAQMTLL